MSCDLSLPPQKPGREHKTQEFLDTVHSQRRWMIEGCYTPPVQKDGTFITRFHLLPEMEDRILHHLTPADKEVQKARWVPEGRRSAYVSVSSACYGTVSCGELHRCHPVCAWQLPGCLRCPQGQFPFRNKDLRKQTFMVTGTDVVLRASRILQY